VYAPIAGGIESLRRSDTADATIVNSYPTILSGGDKAPAVYGLVISYQFEAGGRWYAGTARKRWVSTDGAKVCYDPTDPGGTHALVKASYTCGGFDPLLPDG
jgi:hypothetical protein